jgi:hypothetical protein
MGKEHLSFLIATCEDAEPRSGLPSQSHLNGSEGGRR